MDLGAIIAASLVWAIFLCFVVFVAIRNAKAVEAKKYKQFQTDINNAKPGDVIVFGKPLVSANEFPDYRSFIEVDDDLTYGYSPYTSFITNNMTDPNFNLDNAETANGLDKDAVKKLESAQPMEAEKSSQQLDDEPGVLALTPQDYKDWKDRLSSNASVAEPPVECGCETCSTPEADTAGDNSYSDLTQDVSADSSSDASYDTGGSSNE